MSHQFKPADFHAHLRGGGLVTMLNQWPGAFFAFLAWKLRLKPTHVTLVSLVIGLATSTYVIMMANQGGPTPWALMALVSFLGWQVAYTLDCSDGQLARTTGSGSEAGGRVDILCDIAVQSSVVAAIATIAYREYPELPIWIGATFAALWMTNLVTSVMAKSDTDSSQSLIKSDNIIVGLIKLVRDYSFILIVIAIVMATWPTGMIWVMLGFGAVNALFLLASIAATARQALR